MFLLFLEHITNSIPGNCKYHDTLVVCKRLFFKRLFFSSNAISSIFVPRVEHSVEVTNVRKPKSIMAPVLLNTFIS